MIGPWTLGDGTEVLPVDATAAPADAPGATATRSPPTEPARTANATIARWYRTPAAWGPGPDTCFDINPSLPVLESPARRGVTVAATPPDKRAAPPSR